MYSVFDKFIFRIPVLPVTDHQPPGIDEMNSLLEKNGFHDMLYMSSPDLYSYVTDAGQNKKSRKKDLALLRYYLRSKYRCTPFGLMAGVGIGTVSEQPTEIIPGPMQSFKRTTRLDMNYLCVLMQELSKELYIKKYLKFYPNNSIHRHPDKIRYVEYTYRNGQRNHILTGVENNNYIENILDTAKDGAYIDELVASITDEEISREEKIMFVGELIEVQLLVSELEPSVTGNLVEDQLIALFDTLIASCIPEEDRLRLEDTKAKLVTIKSLLEVADQDGISDSNIEKYQAVEEIIKSFGVDYERKYLFQSDLTIMAEMANFSKKDAEEVLAAVDAVGKLYPVPQKTHLSNFRDAFFERWEYREVPLNIALDTEQGIGYIQPANENNDINPLVDDLAIPIVLPDNQQLEINNKLFQFWQKKYDEALAGSLYEIIITENDLKDLESKTNRLANTFSVMLSQTGKSGKFFIKTIGGSTSANLLGRFCHQDSRIASYIQEMTGKDEAHYDGKIVAEICHLPEARTGNILFRPVLRKYEIPYLTKSAVDTEHQLPVSDLMVSIKNNRVFLRSKKFNKEVIPRLTTAHNYSYKSLPIYHFLSDIQSQDQLGGFQFDPGFLIANSTFIPRISYNEKMILHPAQWQFHKAQFKDLLDVPGQHIVEAFNSFRQKWNMPRYIAFAEADNELVIDTGNADSLNLLVSEIRNKDHIVLVEFLFNPNDAVIQRNNEIYTNEFILSFHKNQITGNQEPEVISDEPLEIEPVKRIFIPGDEWLYFKVYTGYKTADRIVSEVFQPLAKQLLEEQVISKWFFIRYADPKFHLRVRFQLTDEHQCGKVMVALKMYLQQYIEQDTIYNIQIDTYKRELERYGHATIGLAESIFFSDSESVAGILGMLEGYEGETLKWLIALRSVDEYLNLFQIANEQKHAYIDELRGHFAAEFNTDKYLKGQLDKKFRKHKSEIEHWLTTDATIINSHLSDYYAVIENLWNRNEQLKQVAEQLLSMNDKNLFTSHISSFLHMNINRIFRSKNRLHEYVIYDLLEKHYRYLSGKIKAMSKQKESISIELDETVSHT
ncbi:MAG: lantibiotic dehydratase [Dinghuibacter sp.]|nr:lantibiotic dehydratase [Dinghuibacter sp.]